MQKEFYITYLAKETKMTKTRSTSIVSKKDLEMVSKMLPYLYDLYEEAIQLLNDGNVNSRYHTFYINKRNGKRRRIDNPDAKLRDYMIRVIYIFTKKFKILFPNTVYAYVKERSVKDLAELHKDAKFIVKEDIKDFFSSCTLEFIITSMEQVYPFCIMDTAILEVIVKACMIKRDGKYRLPQGAPTSPILSNIGMIPFDCRMEYVFSARNMKYSRYADDIYISRTREVNNPTSITGLIVRDILQETNPEFILNKDKERYINLRKSNGVWITGIHVNHEKEDITIGHESKQKLKATIWSFIEKKKNGKHWTKDEIYKMQGTIGWYKYIEPDYVEMIIQKYEEKTGMDYQKEIRNILCS